jgi:hypothetical protein
VSTPEEQAAGIREGEPAPVPPADPTAPQPGTDPAPAAPADHPAAPDETVVDAPRAPDPQPNTDAPAPAETTTEPVDTADVAPPQLGGATVANQTSLEQANAAKNDPGYVSSKPLLTTGAWGHDVAVLAWLLHEAGYPNPVHAGLEAPMLTDEIMRMVRAFQESQGIDPAGPQRGVTGEGPAAGPLIRRDHEGIVDAPTWAALHEAAGVEVDLAVAEIRYPAGSFA